MAEVVHVVVHEEAEVLLEAVEDLHPGAGVVPVVVEVSPLEGAEEVLAEEVDLAGVAVANDTTSSLLYLIMHIVICSSHLRSLVTRKKIQRSGLPASV